VLYIIVKKGNAIVKSIPFEKEEVVIGRNIDCDLVLNDPLVSRRHCILKKTENRIFLEDRESKNGTFLNGKIISSSKVEAGDEIGVGTFKIEIKELEDIPDERTRELKKEIVGTESVKDFELYIYRDALTGLYSRKFFEDEIKKWGEEVYPLSVFFIDIDDFKKFNDSYGHRAGDLLLNSLGDFLLRNYSNAFPVRWGGEEFLLFFKNIELKSAEKIARKLKDELTEFVEKKVGFKVTISIGVSGVPESAFSLDEAIEKADRAMYKAKAKGKNTVVIYESGSL